MNVAKVMGRDASNGSTGAGFSGAGLRKVAVVTGASSGFGLAMCEEFLKEGWRVVAVVRDLGARDGFFSDERRDGRVVAVEADLSDPASVERAAADLLERAPQIDALVNNAGFGAFGPHERLSPEIEREMFETNVLAPFALVRRLLPALRETKGIVLNVSSLMGFAGFPYSSAYCATKYAIEGWSEALRHELRPHGVRVCAIAPGAFRTRFGANARWADVPAESPYARPFGAFCAFNKRLSERPPRNDPRDVARGAVRLASRRSPPLRARFGQDCRAAWFARRWLPDGWFVALIGAFVERATRTSPRGTTTGRSVGASEAAT